MTNFIAVDGFPQKITLPQVVQLLFRPINGQFEALKFVNKPGPIPNKTCYIRLSERLNAQHVANNINNSMKKRKLYAYIPDSIPNIRPSLKGKSITPGLKKKLKQNEKITPQQILLKSLDEILKEIQHKYTGLYSLSSKTQHKLLENIGLTIADRLKVLLRSAHQGDLSFKLTGRYRVAHPHFGDFQLILSTLHRFEDAAGTPRSQLVEQDLVAPPNDINALHNVPFTKAQEVCNKYFDRILKRLNDYVDSYDVSAKPEDTEEDTARKTVQKHIANTMPYLPSQGLAGVVKETMKPNSAPRMHVVRRPLCQEKGKQFKILPLPDDLIIKQVVANHLVANTKTRVVKMRMYGEPYLPSKELCIPFLNRYRATHVQRCTDVFNALLFSLPRDAYAKIMQADGSNIGPAKVVIRSSQDKTFYLPKPVKEKIAEEVAQELAN